MRVEKTLYVTDRKDWRKWLKNNFDKEKNIWLIYPHKASGQARILYNDAVEEALCFGWIDSTIKKLDKNNGAQRFSPRNLKSSYSQLNKERMKWLLEKKMIHSSILKKAEEIASEKFVFPTDITRLLRKNKVVWKNYNKFSDSYKRIRIAYIESARNRPEDFEKRLSNFIEKTKNNKLIKGFGGTEKYY